MAYASMINNELTRISMNETLVVCSLVANARKLIIVRMNSSDILFMDTHVRKERLRSWHAVKEIEISIGELCKETNQLKIKNRELSREWSLLLTLKKNVCVGNLKWRTNVIVHQGISSSKGDKTFGNQENGTMSLRSRKRQHKIFSIGVWVYTSSKGDRLIECIRLKLVL